MIAEKPPERRAVRRPSHWDRSPAFGRGMPPFGHKLSGLLTKGWQPAGRTLYVASGSHAWDIARDWRCPPRAFLVLPPGDDPEGFNWSAARGLDAIILSEGGIADTEIERLAFELIRHGAGLVYAGRLDSPETGRSWVRQEDAA